MHDEIGWSAGYEGSTLGNVLIVSKEPWRQEGRMRGSSLVQVGSNEESELL